MHKKTLLGNLLGVKNPNTHLHSYSILVVFERIKVLFYSFPIFFFFLDNSLKTRPNLTDKLCIFSTTQREDKGNINVRLNYERELDCTKTVIHKNEFSFHLSSTSS